MENENNDVTISNLESFAHGYKVALIDVFDLLRMIVENGDDHECVLRDLKLQFIDKVSRKGDMTDANTTWNY